MCCGLLPNIHIKVFTSYDARTVTRSPAVYSGGKPHITPKEKPDPHQSGDPGGFHPNAKKCPPELSLYTLDVYSESSRGRSSNLG